MHSSRGGTLQLGAEPAEARAQRAVGRDAAADRQALEAGLLERALGALRERLDDRVLVGGGEVGAAGPRRVLAELAQR